jgi:uncharacterized membrane protein YkoI
MKKTLFLVAALVTTLCSSAQNIKQAQAPDLVVETFQKKFPRVTDVEWKKKGDAYEVMFDTGFGNDHRVLIDATGKIISHRQEIAITDLPAAVTSALAKQFPDFKIEDPEKREMNDATTYKMEVKGKTEEWKVIFSEDGKLLEKTAD